MPTKVRRLMPGEYLLKTHVTFAAAHQLRGYQGPCARVHGHNYRLEVELAVSELDDIGLGLDFGDIREALAEKVADLDHRFINDIEPFDSVNPTAENLARVLYERLGAQLNDGRCRVHAVTLSETDRSSVRYYERD